MKLGDKLRDRNSDFVGEAVGSLETFSGFTQFLVASKDKDGGPDNHWIDVVQLVVVEEAEEDRTPELSGNLALGDRVKDISSGWFGTLVGIVKYLNGCVRYELQGPGRDGVPTVVALDEALCEKQPVPAAVPQGPARQGGSTSLQSVRK